MFTNFPRLSTIHYYGSVSNQIHKRSHSTLILFRRVPDFTKKYLQTNDSENFTIHTCFKKLFFFALAPYKFAEETEICTR